MAFVVTHYGLQQQKEKDIQHYNYIHMSTNQLIIIYDMQLQVYLYQAQAPHDQHNSYIGHCVCICVVHLSEIKPIQ